MYNFTDARFIEQSLYNETLRNDFVYKYYKLCAI